MARGRRSSLFIALWNENRYNRLPLVFTLIVRGVVVCMFIFYIIRYLVPFADPLLLLLALLMVGGIALSRPLLRNTIRMEKVFMENLHSRDGLEHRGKQPEYAEHLLSKDLHLADFEVPEESIWGVPSGSDRVYPHDHLQVIGSDRQISVFAKALEGTVIVESEWADHEMQLKQVLVADGSAWAGQSIKNSGIRERYHCMVVGVETPEGVLEKPKPDRVFRAGDIIWLVGEKDALAGFLNARTD